MKTNNKTSRKLGKRLPANKPAVEFGKFLQTLPPCPIVDAAPNFNYPMDGNDVHGDCVVAGYDHSEQTFTGLLEGNPKNYTIDQIYTFYKTQNPGFPSQDDGMDMQIFLEYLVANKFIRAFARVAWQSEQELKSAIYLGLSVMIGVQLQQAQMQAQFDQGLWDYAPGSPSVGGHCINLIGFDGTYYYAVSWGKVLKLTKQFVSKLCDEAWFLITDRHIAHPGFRNSYDLQGFAQAVSEITGGKVVVPVSPSPTPTTNFIFTKPLNPGQSNPDVKQLQMRLATEKAQDGGWCYRYAKGGKLYFSNAYGVNTTQAVQRYQTVKGIVTSGTPSTTGFGVAGARTIASLNAASAPAPLPDLYTAAKNSLGKHMTLNDLVPQDVGCAEAVSAVLKLVGVNTGAKGIAGTAQLYSWLKKNPQFVQLQAPEQGAVLVSPTGLGNGKVEGHTGIFGGFGVQYPCDWGIMSNNSSNGLFQEQWSWTRWQAYYGKTGGLPCAIFKLISNKPMATKKFGALTSSVDNNQFSLTVTGIIGVVASLIVGAAAHWNYNLPYDTVVGVVSAGATTIAGIITLIGLIRKPIANAAQQS